MKSKIAAAALLVLPFTGQYALAEEAVVEESAFTISTELGFLFTTGNTKTGDLKAALNIQYEKGQWLHVLAFNALAKKVESENTDGKDVFESTENKWDIVGQTNYSLDEDGKNYLYANVYYQQDKFSSFLYQTSGSIGWGRQLIDTETTTFFADIGPGVKYDVIREDLKAGTIEYSETAPIVQAQALFTHQVNDFVEFKQYLVAKQTVQSGKNSIYKSETSLTTKLNDSLQFKVALRIDYDTHVDEGFENTNTETTATLVYEF